MIGKTAFEEKFGFRRDEVTLANWRTTPFSRWSFQNAGELVPSARMTTGAGLDETPTEDMSNLLSEKVSLPNGEETISAFLERSHADALTVMKGGRFVGDWQAPHMEFGNRHLVFSISKSLTAIVAGILEGEGLFDPEAPVVRYMPAAAGSAYGDAAVRHILDMTVSLDFQEAYLDPQSAFARYRRAMLWNPGGGDESLAEFLVTLQRAPRPHGEAFHYCSPNSDMLGILLERASEQRIPDLMRDRLWGPLGARAEVWVTVDGRGSSRTGGGISLTPRDLARVGEMMRQQGTVDGKAVVPAAWVKDTLNSGSREAWLRGDLAKLLPEGRYRNKWYQCGDGSFCTIGIHGQWLFVDPASETVIVKMSSQPEPVDDPLDFDCLALFRELRGRI